ncbi:MAG: HAMP domain-containing histidine kinase [Clostridiales bacterium]|nr:HAMP domain-containing histidine kinase [Clostridiales bacterium]
MIKDLRLKFIAVSMISMMLVLAVIVGTIHIFNYRNVKEEADELLAFLQSQGGAFPESRENHFFDDQSPELAFRTRFFSVTIDEDGSVLQADIRNISAVDEENAIDYARDIAESGKKSGFLGQYRYLASAIEGGTRVIFLDCYQELTIFYSFLFSSLLISFGGLLAVLVLLIIFSGRVVRPVEESYEKQRRFITDAGHEIKTPLTIISADASILEMDYGENEWLNDIHVQTERLRGLTDDLIYLSRMEEQKDSLTMQELSISEVIMDTARSFQGPARVQKKEFSCEVAQQMSCRGDEKSIRQLLNILLENAMKYSPEGGTISLQAAPQGKNIRIVITNDTVEPVAKESLDHLFDRFYRAEESRNSQTGGYGIGLAIARAIVTAHKGKIYATSENGHSLSVTVVL